MSLAIYSHTIIVKVASEAVDPVSLAVFPPSYANGVTVSGQLEPKTTGAVYQSHGVVLKNPAIFRCDLADADKFGAGAHVVLGTRIFAVQQQPRRFDAGDPDDYADVLLDELNYG